MINNHKILKNLTFRSYGTRVLGLFFSIFFLACQDPGKIEKYTVNFDSLGGTGGPTSLSSSSGTPLIEPSAKPSRADSVEGTVTTTYYFGGWYTSELEQDGTTKYQFGSSLNADLNLYARWYTSQPADKAALQDLLNEASSRTSSNPDALNLIDVRQVIDMSALFRDQDSFNYDISRWDTSAVTNMNEMFKGAAAFDQDLSAWADKAGRDTTNMFAGATLPNDQRAAWMPKAPFTVIFDARGGTGGPTSLSISSGTSLMEPSAKPSRADSVEGTATTTYYFGGWYTSELEQDGTTKYQFGSSLNADLNLYARWYTSQPADKAALQALLNQASSLTSSNPDALNLIDVRQVTDMSSLFRSQESFNYDISRWDTAAVTSMHRMFEGAKAFNGNIGTWKTGAVTDMSSMFRNASAFNRDLDKWDTSAVTSMNSMFYGASAFNGNIGGWKTGAVTDMSSMFKDASAFNQDLSWDTLAVTTMNGMFNRASVFNGNIGSWKTGAVTNMGGMFHTASAFNQDLDKWDTSAVTTMSWMFFRALAFNGNIGTWKTGAVTDMSSLFRNASAFNQDLTLWAAKEGRKTKSMFTGADSMPNDKRAAWMPMK